MLTLTVQLGNASNAHAHVHDHAQAGGDHGHTHDIMENPGLYSDRDQPLGRGDFSDRSFTVGVGGPVGSGKTALLLALCRALGEKYNMACLTNDIFTKE
ncbi:hypothetical protein SARC_16662, partial [Sphaeroforma arctica JP610]